MDQNSPTIFSESKIKTDMMELWKETFHDSDRYIGIVFDTYFNLDNICVRYCGERLISALLGVPYAFRIDGREATGMYLCGLATAPSYRRQGIMGIMMREIEVRATERGFDMTFLIPADNGLREYYRRKGYHDSCMLSHSYIPGVTADDGVREYTGYSKIHISDLPHNLRAEWIGMLATWCSEKERRVECDMMLHSRGDFEAVLRENENAFFLTESTCDPKYPILAKVVSVGLPGAKFGVPCHEHTIRTKRDTKSSDGINQMSPYGMVKILNPDMDAHQIPITFAMSLMLD